MNWLIILSLLLVGCNHQGDIDWKGHQWTDYELGFRDDGTVVWRLAKNCWLEFKGVSTDLDFEITEVCE